MDDSSALENDEELEEEEEANVPIIGLSYHDDHLWIDETRISPDDCPDCIKGEGFDCDLCVFFIPEECHLRGDPLLLQDIRTLFNIFLARRTRQLRRQKALIRAIHSELKAHGRPLHYTVLAQMVADRNPQLKITETSVVRIMAYHPRVFERVAEGVYQCR
jgi:hypothetical protein